MSNSQTLYGKRLLITQEVLEAKPQVLQRSGQRAKPLQLLMQNSQDLTNNPQVTFLFPCFQLRTNQRKLNMLPNQSHTLLSCYLACLQCSHAHNLQSETSPFSVKLSHVPDCLSGTAVGRWWRLMPGANILHWSHWSGPRSLLECATGEHSQGQIQKHVSHPWKWVQALINLSNSGTSSSRNEYKKSEKSIWIFPAALFIILKKVEPICLKVGVWLKKLW